MYMTAIFIFPIPLLKHSSLPEGDAMDVHSSLSSISHDVYSAELKRVNSAGSVLSFQHLSYAVSTKGGQKTLIDDITVNVCAGELLAVMVSYLVISFIYIPLQSANSWYEFIRALLVQVSLSFIICR